MYVEFTEHVPGSAVVSHVKKEIPESPHVGDVVPLWIDGRLVPCRVVARTWRDRTEPGPSLICQVAQIYKHEPEEPVDGEAQEETDADSK